MAFPQLLNSRITTCGKSCGTVVDELWICWNGPKLSHVVTCVPTRIMIYELKTIISEHQVTDEEILSFKAGLRHPNKLDMAQLLMVNVIPDGLESDANVLSTVFCTR
jgi:hypothetical protein